MAALADVKDLLQPSSGGFTGYKLGLCSLAFLYNGALRALRGLAAKWLDATGVLVWRAFGSLYVVPLCG